MNLMKPFLFAAMMAAFGPAQEAQRLRVLTTTPELADLARQVGGPRVSVRSLLRGPEDPHFVDARPSFIREANRAGVFVLNGLELEDGYAPLLLSESRNPRIQPGRPGFVDCSVGISPLEVPRGVADRSMGHVHASGNPHYLLDPMNARVVARNLRDAFTRVDPGGASVYAERAAAFKRRIETAMFGERLLERFSADALAELLAGGRLLEFLQEKEAAADLAGWAAQLAPLAGAPMVTFHAGGLSYMAHRFALEVAEALEPKPGIAPSSGHLSHVVEVVRAREIKAVVRAVYNPHAAVERVARLTGAATGVFAHQAGSVEGTEDYFAMIDHNVRLLAELLAAG